MAEMLKSFSRPGMLGLFLSLMVVAMLTIPAEALAANVGHSYNTGEEVSSSPAIGDNSTIYDRSWEYQLYAMNLGSALQWSYTTDNWLWYFLSNGSDVAIDTGSDDGKPDVSGGMESPITIVSPKGGESYAIDKWQTITWRCTVHPGYYVKIELLKNGAFYQTITSRTPVGSGGSGSYVWIIPDTQTIGDDYRVKVTSTSNSTCTGTSENNFTITTPPIGVTSPGDDEYWTRGRRYNISWTYNGYPGPYVKIDLLRKGIYHRTIITEISLGSRGRGFYSWTIPSSEILGNYYQIRVTSTADASFTATSKDYFIITNISFEEEY